jgi:pteridine reductase
LEGCVIAQAALKGQTALVTGAGKRVGRAIACALAQAGMSLVIHYRTSAAEAATLVEALRARGMEAWALRAHLADPEQVERLIPEAIHLAGRLDLLVNNASVFPAETSDEATFAALVETLATNTWAPFALTRAFAKHVGRGQVINLLDSRITSYDPGHVGYLTSKQALAALTRTCALAYAPDVAVNAVAPGLVLEPVGGADAGYMARVAHTLPLRRYGTPEDVAAAVLYLAGTTFVTGEIIRVDGGRHLKDGGCGAE